MSSSVKQVLEDRIDALNDDISWIESDIKRSADFLARGEERLAEVVADRDAVQSFLDEHFPKDVVLEQLQKTREVLAERGRIKKKFIDEESCEVCLLGAIGVAVLGEEFEASPAFYPFYDPRNFHKGDASLNPGAAYEAALAISAELPAAYQITSPYQLYEFNDAPATTDEDVFDLIDRAIETRKAAA